MTIPPTRAPNYRTMARDAARAVVAALAVVVLLAGCSDAAPSTTTALDGAADTTTTPTAPTTTTVQSTTTTTAGAATTSTALATTTTTPTTTTSVASSTSSEVVEVEYSVALVPGGLLLVRADTGSTARLDFGTEQTRAIDAVEVALGPAAEVTSGSAECPNGQDAVAAWPGIIQLAFMDGAFLAWSLDPGSPLTDLTGVGLGSALAELSAAWDVVTFESTLGTEFLSDDDASALGGLLSDPSESALVTAFWAGPICAFR